MPSSVQDEQDNKQDPYRQSAVSESGNKGSSDKNENNKNDKKPRVKPAAGATTVTQLIQALQERLNEVREQGAQDAPVMVTGTDYSDAFSFGSITIDTDDDGNPIVLLSA